MPAPDTPHPTERTAGVFPHANTRRENPPYDPRKMNKTAPIVCLLLTCVLPGCVIGDIRDELGTANRQLTDLDSAVSDLDKIRLANLEEQLVILKAIDDNLTAINERLFTVEGSLVVTNDHLASLRRTINNIDSTIPFLSLSGDDEEDRAELDGADSDQQTDDPNGPAVEVETLPSGNETTSPETTFPDVPTDAPTDPSGETPAMPAQPE